MSSAMFVVLKESHPEAQALIDDFDGRALADQMERLDALAERLGVLPLLGFYSMDPEELASMMNSDDLDDQEDDDDEDEDDDDEPDTGEREPGGARAWHKGDIADAEAGDRHEDDGSGAFVEQWFAAKAGLASVRALLQGIEDNPRAVGKADQVAADLSTMARILEIAEAAGIPFHVAMEEV